jgi:hypothetical protein
LDIVLHLASIGFAQRDDPARLATIALAARREGLRARDAVDVTRWFARRWFSSLG